MLNSVQTNVILAHLFVLIHGLVFGWGWIFWGAIAAWIILNLVVSLYIHRIRCHKNFDVSNVVHHIGSFIFSGLNLGSPSVYVAVHIKHHRESGTEDDPHDPYTKGLWNVLFSNWDSSFSPDRKKLREEFALPYTKFYHKHQPKITKLFIAVFPILPMLAFWHTKFVTIVVHLKSIGYQNYETGEGSKNVWWLKPLLWGEELHNNHHAMWVKPNHNHKNTWKEFDLLYYVGVILQALKFR